MVTLKVVLPRKNHEPLSAIDNPAAAAAAAPAAGGIDPSLVHVPAGPALILIFQNKFHLVH